jgi:urea carboxylase-associated protein 1
MIWATDEADYFNDGEPFVDGETVRDERIAARAGWSGVVRAGQVLTIVDVGANQSGDCLIYDANDHDERYSVPDTIAAQGNVYLDTGSVLMSNEGNPLMTVIGNEIPRQDTIGGACSKESNTLRYGHHTLFHHACRENFLAEGGRHGLGARDLVSNINWFMNVPVGADGTLGIVDGLSAPGKRVALRAERDVLVVISNCPQVNNPCNDFNPTPLRAIITEPSR